MNMKKFFNLKKISTMLLIFSLVVISLFQSPLPAMAISSLKLQMYNSTITTSTNGITPCFKFTNTESTTINLSEIKLRYYYTSDANLRYSYEGNPTQAQSFTCDYSSVGTSNVTGTFVAVTQVANADCYLEVGFTSAAGNLLPGATVVIQTRVTKSDYSNYNQTDDYSFDSSNISYVDCNKSTMYQNGTLVCGTPPTPTPIPTPKFLIIVSNSLYKTGDMASKISTYMSDLSNEGWASTLIKLNNVSDNTADYICSTPENLKEVIKSYYNDGYEGFVLIGSDPQIPTAYWEDHSDDLVYGPTDLFYADMDNWTDNDADGKYESYDLNNPYLNGTRESELFWGRISAAGITDSSITAEASKICSYFDKIHNYRVNGGNLNDEQKKRTLLFYDTAGFNSLRDQVAFKGIGSEIYGLFDDSLTTPQRLAQELQKGYAFVNQIIHSSYYGHQLSTWDEDHENFDYSFNLDLLNSFIPKVNYINMFSCSACKYQDSSGPLPNFGETYLFNNDYVINVSGFTATDRRAPIGPLWDGIAHGKPVGQAFMNAPMSTSPSAVLLGDPTMVYRVSPVTNQAPHITTNLADSSVPNKARLEITSGEEFVINATDPDENDYVTIDIEGLPSDAVVSKSDKCFTWTPSSRDTGLIYNLTATAYNKDSNNNIINKYVENFTVKVASGKLLNAGFEENVSPTTLSNWTKVFNIQSGTFLPDSTKQHSGQYSARIISNIYSNDCRGTQNVKVNANTNYRLSGYIKTINVTSGKGATLCAKLPSMIINTSASLMGTNDWTPVWVDFNTGDNESVDIQVCLGMYDATNTDLGLSKGVAWFDDLSLEKLP